MTQRRHRAQLILDQVSRAYPEAWAQVDRLRQLRGKEIPAWPAWCYLPLSGAEAIVSAHHDPGPPPRAVPWHYGHHIGIVGALAAWRVSQGVYRYDADLARALDETPIPKDLPLDVLHRLPEWCVYLETPGLWAPDGQPLAGAWVHLEWDERGADELRVLLDVDQPPDQALSPRGLIPVPLILGAGSIAEALARVTASGAAQAEAHGYRVDPQLRDGDQIAARLWPIVSRVLYLCADDPDFGDRDRPRRPQPTRTKNGYRLFPAPGLTRWDVGVRIGAAIRRAQEQAEAGEREALTSGRSRPRAHVRKAHWHTFLTGPRAEDRKSEQRRILHWIPPLPINVEDAGDLPATVHDVE